MLAVVAAAIGGALVASQALAVPAQQPTPNPWPAKKAKVFFYVDTVTSGKGEGKVDADKFCAQRNFFQRGNRVVFRMSAVEARSETILTDKNVQFAKVLIPGAPDIDLRYGKHGRTDDAPWYWTAAWDTPLDFPTGLVDFQIVVKTKLLKVGKKRIKPTTAIFKQIPIPLAQLTIIP